MKVIKSTIAFLIFSLCQPVFAEDLMDVYNTAVRNDTTIRQAQAAFLGSEHVHRQSKAQLLPSADFSADATHSDQEIGDSSNSSSDWGYTLTITQSVFNRSNFDLLNKTSKLQQKSKADLEAAQQNLILQVAEGYFNVLAAQDNLEFAQAEIEANARQLEQTRQRFEVGLIAITDVHEAQAAHDLAVAREIVAQNDLTSQIEAVRELTGAYIDQFKKLNGEIPLVQPEPANADSWVENALQNNLRILSSQLDLASSKADIKQRQAGHLPTLDLVARHSYNDDAGDTFNNESMTDNSLILQLNLPLYRGGGTSAQIKESEQAFNQKLAQLEQIERNVHRQTRDAYASVIANISQVNALNQGIISTQSSLEASQAGLEVGTRTTVDVLNTRRELFRAQRDHARARYDYILSTLRLKEASGSLSATDLEAINSLLQ